MSTSERLIGQTVYFKVEESVYFGIVNRIDGDILRVDGGNIPVGVVSRYACFYDNRCTEPVLAPAMKSNNVVVPGNFKLGVDNISGQKYMRVPVGLKDGKMDVYAALATFDVKCPATAHAIKKLLCAGLRGKGDRQQDLREAIDAVLRAIELDAEVNT